MKTTTEKLNPSESHFDELDTAMSSVYSCSKREQARISVKNLAYTRKYLL